MRYYSTNHNAPEATLEKAIIKGLAEDRGLYMPETIRRLPKSFFENIDAYSFHEIAFQVASAFFGDDIESEALSQIVKQTLNFDCPIVEVENNIFALELFHGPTLAFKDVGARFMARALQYYISKATKQHTGKGMNVLVATSGDTGAAVANGFWGVEGIHVFVLYPKGKVSKIQESQFTTLKNNITALEVDGVFDDCQSLVKTAFMDEELNSRIKITSANSINVARFLPQAFYYFHAYAQLRKLNRITADMNELVFCTPSGNFGNITAGLFGQQMGLPVKRFIAANNANDVFFNYLTSGIYQPQPSIQTIANAMDVGNPSNFVRIKELFKGSWSEIKKHVDGIAYTDDMIKDTIRRCYNENKYILDPHGACGFQALKDKLAQNEVGIFLETAHPAKFKKTIDDILGRDIPIPQRLQNFMQGAKQSIEIKNDYSTLRQILIEKAI
ncbi:threonine synthase [Prevotella sp. A2931]|uniref:Threonine synthase n=1 Tax=Prevotella illustrans TaxID=2800387 RepID=A0ABS3M2P7_9BACT|nr:MULTISPECIES: threonine synthase [Prevotella]MBO1362454.1 threonine synthase [Prevotella illustrans]PTL25034.1 threonine synthase [Prevotella sp. oral taxon 820]